MAKKRKLHNKRGGKAPLRRKDGMRIVERELQAFLKEVTENDEPMYFSTSELQIIYTLYFRLSTPAAEEGQFIPGKELRKMGRLVHTRLHEPMLQFDNRWYSFRELNLLYCYSQVMNIKTIKPDRRFELWKYLGNIANFEMSTDIFSELIFVHLYKTISACSDVRHKVYTLALTRTHQNNSDPILHYNMRMGVNYAVKNRIKIHGKPRLVYRMILPRLYEPEFLNFIVKDFKECHDADKDEIPVYIQSHALNRMKERLDLLDNEALNYNMFRNLYCFKHFYDVGSYLLIPFHLYDVKVGYFCGQIVDDCFVIRTFLFITHFSTPEGSELKDICGLGRKDVDYWKIDRLSTFMNVDAKKYPLLLEMFEKAGCGDLFKLQNEEFTTEAMQNSNLDGLREFLKKGQMEIL